VVEVASPFNEWGANRVFAPKSFIRSAQVIHTLLVLAIILAVLWFLFHASIAIMNLIWIAVVVLVVLWLIGFLRGRSAAP
jgi:hypothetical protein